ncbi:M20/M25/M40 family metallo-hydrolase [bacterium]|nr:M20/M25/M40 family metallo-hydrolase [bacterium]
MRRLLGLVLLAIVLAATALAQSSPEEKVPPGENDRSIAAVYSGVAERIVGAALVDDRASRRLEWLSDHIGNRLSGSPQLDLAIAWALREMERDGLENVHKEKAMVPCWVRGHESAELVSPTKRPLVMLGLGMSTGTPPEGITADVVVVRSFDELEAQGEKCKGKIVLYNAPFTSYGETVQYRVQGASRAAKLGAVAALVRSVTAVSLRSPHTGTLHYAEDQPRIPAAAITIEDAETLARLQARGERVRVTLKMEAKMLPDVESANVVAEVRGSERPDEIVLVGGHLDSWDVGTGSMDDGGGIAVSWEAVRLVKRLGLRPRRTLRVVLFTNEENGTRGALAYKDAHASELAKHVLAIESDSGVARPTGFGAGKAASPAARAAFKEIASLLRGLGADRIGEDGGGADIAPLMKEGVLGMELSADGSHYFDIHHTQADTFDKIDRTSLSMCSACMGVMAYIVADLPERVR